ncbi:hypothetical protein LTR10_019056 [Elasticomyces elasticus]|uniref:PHD-type domain-containing protein n=1 Tax=Exophiala sideris TaxID=1016849 RepID=A0A0D1YEI9_9EURO|nr:hypothetical protein LTR10_019056 [Elasticomyces elasticus]KAK5022942.1 hypothetical protein LTS07_009670 [Exophiala sideris]KAK5177341.1 hypothetical protein LTR44_010136 [Eurotiomycetes sp. CCFEE 6388]KAK5026379.1 hypothetical protein LTR13_009993 [Exophiala sideris]KAK5052313.1 hypothetical protein LTR69_009849 [Exophiala sideris]
MSDTCIVCLGDLSNGNGDVAALPTTLAKSPLLNAAAAVSKAADTENINNATHVNVDADHELIAHLRPCGHYLHNECLTPWVERANSCPICRASFHLVDLMYTINGDVVSSYSVEERTQVAELDPSIFFEIPEEEDEDQPCQACGEDDNEDVLMYCDGCQKLWHTYCVDLQEVPFGHWFCDNCRAQRDVDPRQQHVARSGRITRRRTRGQQRRQRGHESSWNQVWQTVWSRINLDLDFPYEEDESSATYLRRHRQHTQANRQAHDAWRRRMQVAELHGAGNRFRETEPAAPSSPGGESTPRSRRLRASPRAPVENADELMAWHAFEQARASPNESSSSKKRKRKSRTASPKEREGEATPAIKRRRPSVSTRTVSERGTSSARNVRSRQSSRLSSPTPRRPLHVESGAPTFLQSLLQEVEESGASSHSIHLHRPSPRPGASPPAEQVSPRPSSPAVSPLPSNHSSPRPMSATPPPATTLRPSSPAGLTSSIQPVFPSTEYSPLRTISPDHIAPTTSESPDPQPLAPKTISSTSPTLAQPRPRTRVPRILDHTSGSMPQSRSTEASPTRTVMSLSAKEDVQKLVASALKPHYHDQTISKDEYTTINRDISRKLYDKIGDFEELDRNNKAKWEKVAGDEVQKAIVALKADA